MANSCNALFLKFPFLISCAIILLLSYPEKAISQQYYMQEDGNPSVFWDVHVDCYALNCAGFYDLTFSPNKDRGLTLTPLGKMYGIDDYSTIYEIDTSSGSTIVVLPTSNQYYLDGLAAVSDSILYTIDRLPSPDNLMRINILSGSITIVKHLDHYTYGDLALFDGKLYYTGSLQGMDHGLISINLEDTSDHGTWVLDIPSYRSIHAVSATRQCYLLIGADNYNEQFITLNLMDGVIEYIGDLPYINQTAITGLVEFETPLCEVALDMDSNNSSGADGWDFQTIEYNCHSDEVFITDDDVGILYDTFIQQLTVSLVGFIPDGSDEFLEINVSAAGLDISGSGTQTITLTNSTGTAPSSSFKYAIRQITYQNTALFKTPGQRTIEAQFVTYSGAETEIAIAYLDIAEGTPYSLDLGPDLEVCEGEAQTLDTEIDDVSYMWSTGSPFSFITVSMSGQYSVTVSGDEFCPAADTIDVNFLPVIHVDMPEEVLFCDVDEMVLTIQTDSDIPLTIEIIATPGGAFTLNDVTGTYEYPVNPAVSTSYFIQNVTPAQPSCIEVENDFMTLEVFPTYFDSLETGICEGDSFLINNTWVSEEGYYTSYLLSLGGCDSIVTHHVFTQTFLAITEHNSICNIADTGTFVTHLDNPDGCDTILTQIFHFIPLDTTWVSGLTCRKADEGIFSNVLISSNGCDSVVTTTLTSIPSDTSSVYYFLCDSAALGISEEIFPNMSGCDSLVIRHYLWGSSDTTYILTTSCDSASLGVFEETLISQSGCDSTVFTTVTYSASDSTFLLGESCNVDDVGVFTEAFINGFGCDSIVTTTISLLPESETFITTSTCDPVEAGVFVENLTNQYGCDSIVTKTVELLPGDETFLSSTTCMSTEAGVFVNNYLNQYGCDSVVTLTVLLVPSDTTLFSFKTCDPAQVGNIENTYANIDDCDSLVIQETTLYPLPDLELEITSDYNGYAISCAGQSDGSAFATITGIPPFDYLWSTSSTDPSISGLSAGSYSITITDGNGCTASSEVMLFEPEEFSISFIVSLPDCFENQDGTIMVEQSGGVDPIRYSIDEVNYQSSPVFSQLSGGTYTINAIDANDCETKEIIWINVPLMVHVELPDDQVALPGDTILIQAIVNVPFDSLANVEWSGLSTPVCPNCLSQPIAPIITTTYSVTVTSLDGCMDEDAMTLVLERNNDVYVPNIFSPNGDGLNDVFRVYAGPGVRHISTFIIYDRWGNLVYDINTIQPDDPYFGWDGSFNGNKVNPGVFAYLVIVEYKDYTSKVFYGDVTVIR